MQIRLEEFAKVIYSFLGDPVKFSGKTSFLFDDSESGGYRLVFGDGQQVWLKMPEEEFQLRSAVWWLADEFGRQLKRDREITTAPTERRPRAEVVYYPRWQAGLTTAAWRGSVSAKAYSSLAWRLAHRKSVFWQAVRRCEEKRNVRLRDSCKKGRLHSSELDAEYVERR